MKTEKTQIVRTTAVLLVAAGMISLFVIAKRPVALSATIPSASREVRSKIYFEQNRGQVDERAKFISRGAGPTMFLAATEAVYVLPMPSEEDGEKGRRGDMESAMADASFRRDVPASQRLAFALRMQFVGANPAAEVSGDGELVTRANYFRGNDPSRWLTDVPAFSRVRYDDVYPDIDLEFYGNGENKSQYDFIVQPNADASRIELDFAGAESVAIEPESGDLLINTAAGTIKQSSPFSYQQTNGAKQAIASSYELTGRSSVRFRLGEYDRSRPLVIDPALGNLAFSSFLGGASFDSGADIKVDAAGNAYVVGSTTSDLFPTTTGVFDTTKNGGTDIFVSKIGADGSNLIFSTYIGGNDSDQAVSLAIDSAGSIFVAGNTRGVNYPTTAGAYDTTVTGSTYDVVVTKLNASGNQLIYSTFVGNSADENCQDIAVDSTGNAFVTGYTNSVGDYPTTPGSYDTVYNGGPSDGFVTKLNPSGTALVYSTLLGGSSFDMSRGIVIDSSGNALVIGSSASGPDGNGLGAFPTTVGSFDPTINGFTDAFVTKLNPTGTGLLFSTFLGGTGNDEGKAIALDQVGNAYVTGNTASSDYPVTLDAYDQTQGGSGNFDVFVTKLSTAGNSLSYSTYIGESVNENGNSIALDSTGAAYICGIGNTGSPTTANAFDPIPNGFIDAYVLKLNPAGSGLSYATFLGGSLGEFAYAIALDPANNVYVTGYTNSQEFPATTNAFQTEWAGEADAFVAKLGNFAISGRAVDVSGAAVPNATIALSGSSSETKLTDVGGNFIFLDALPNRPYTVTASKAGTIFNPSLFNIGSLDDNRNLFFIAGGAPGGGGGGSNLSFAANSFTANESGGATVVRVWRDAGTITSTVTVNYATSDATAIAGPDYVAASGVLTFAPGVTERTFSVFVRDDLSTEGIESLNLTLSNATGGATLGTSAATLNIDDNGEPQIQSGGYTLGIVSIPGSLKNRHIVGIAASNTDGTVFVAADNNFIEPPTGLTNSCGTQPVQSSFDLFRILPNGNTTLLGNFQIPHRSLVNLELSPVDGLLYTVGTDRKVYSINPAGGPAAVFNSDVGFDTDRYGLEADAGGNLIMMQYGSPNSFYRVAAGTGATFLGSYANDSAANFGDRFGIQPDGDYVVYSDAPAGRTPREFEIDTTGHIDGTPFNFSYLTGSNMRTLGSSYILSNGAINPVTGDVFSSGGNCSAGSSVILATAAGGNSSSVSSTFISGIGNNYTDGADNYNARGVTDLDFGARRDGLPGKCLYFADDYNDVIYSACGFAPTAANVAVSGRVFSPDGSGLRNASVSITDSHGNVRRVTTGSFGYFRFDEIVAGESYVVAVTSKRYVFSPRIVNPTDELTDVDFIPQ